jgi:hypothetical protein
MSRCGLAGLRPSGFLRQLCAATYNNPVNWLAAGNPGELERQHVAGMKVQSCDSSCRQLQRVSIKPNRIVTTIRHSDPAATRTRLESLGYKYSEKIPQLLINFSGQLSDKLRVDSAPAAGGYYGYRSGKYGAWGGYNSTYVDQYTEGTVNIDMVDAAANRMVWEGIVTGRVTDKTKENLGPVLDAVVAELLAEFPAHAGN